MPTVSKNEYLVQLVPLFKSYVYKGSTILESIYIEHFHITESSMGQPYSRVLTNNSQDWIEDIAQEVWNLFCMYETLSLISALISSEHCQK